MSQAQTAVAPRKFAGRAKSGVFYGLTWGGLVAAGLAAAWMVAGIVGGWHPAIIAVPWLCLLAAGSVRVGGRTIVGWAPVIGGYAARSATGNTRFARRIHAPRASANLGLPGDAARLLIVPEPSTGAALVHDQALKRLTAILRVRHLTRATWRRFRV